MSKFMRTYSKTFKLKECQNLISKCISLSPCLFMFQSPYGKKKEGDCHLFFFFNYAIS